MAKPGLGRAFLFHELVILSKTRSAYSSELLKRSCTYTTLGSVRRAISLPVSNPRQIQPESYRFVRGKSIDAYRYAQSPLR